MFRLFGPPKRFHSLTHHFSGTLGTRVHPGFCALLVFLFGFPAFGQNHLPSEKAWFDSARLGIFVHWLLDDFPEDEPEIRTKNFPAFQKAARKKAAKFTATNYSPEEWAAGIKKTGARYAIITTKHHLGFALYDAPGAGFNAAKNSSAKRDLLKPWTEAIRKEGIKVGLYFSLPDRMHPLYESVVLDSNNRVVWEKSDLTKWKKFTDQMLSEVSHLCRNYGKIDLFWFDGDWERTADLWRSFDLMDTVKKYQPQAVINNRLRHRDLGDYSTPEMRIPLTTPSGYPAWELCTTMGYNWCGPDGVRFLKEPEELLRIFSQTNTMGGNLLLNITPDQTGQISKEQWDRLEPFGQWIRENREAILGTHAGLPPGYFNGGSTQKNGVLYLWVQDYPEREVVVKGLEGMIRKVSILSSGKEIPFRGMRDYHEEKGRIGWRFISIPKEMRNPLGLVLKVEFEGNQFSVGKLK
jgi:alpha-L-fucosidase